MALKCHMKRAALYLGTSMAALCAANAQETESPRIMPQGTILDRIVVSAGRDKVAIDTPQAVTVVEQDDIDKVQATTVGDIFRTIPGVKAVGSDRVAGESFNIRGIGSLGAPDENRIIVQVDGVTKFYEQYRVGSFFSDPELYKRVEVLRGPASSTLYGAGALAGVVTFTTKDATDFLEDGDNFSARFKTGFDTNRGGALGSVILASRLGENTDLLIAGNARRGDNFRDGGGDIIDGSEFEAFSGLVKANHYFGEGRDQRIWASYQHWQSDADDTVYSQTGTLAAFGRTDRKITDRTAILGYQNEGAGNPWLDLEASLAYSNTTVEQRNTTFFAFGPRADYGYETLQGKLQNTFEFATGPAEHFLTLGLDANHQIRTAEQNSGAIAFHPEGESRQGGVFAQNEIILGGLTLIPGARLDYTELTPGDRIAGAAERDFTGFSPKIAALYEVTPWVSVFGSLARTERMPVLDELYDTRRGLSLDLEPETSNNIEGGLAFSFADVALEADSLSIKGTVFHNEVTNLIEPQTAVPGATQTYRNVSEAILQGIEIEAAYSSEFLFANLAYSLIRGKNETTGAWLNSVPADELVLTVGAFVPSHDIEIGLISTFAADQNRVSGTVAPTGGYAVFDAYAAWTPEAGMFRGLEARLAVDNIFDRDYSEHLAGDPARGRSIRLSLARTF